MDSFTSSLSALPRSVSGEQNQMVASAHTMAVQVDEKRHRIDSAQAELDKLNSAIAATEQRRQELERQLVSNQTGQAS
ncbi:uncharacterized protein L969DRAFT_89339 [Mixia osmundae IAM 14324]|uniref:Uncharacterized protein n=1 Tax=Mixia osmundae (strain CBS 9802 / IAM 14324 / JCM 22182 / KY 12970) TaxID=764103 RepID=G7DX06_MIXOS|nr:uncharacterized protein L969DRAFT_89339 [Mixia osmundae IAM 14324]KEI38088.1 hypothetical protein L969DRAFT_89339 [Mixia osmundae IAM 14324]GAA95103.1 hypothetical protein E5Q_01758 [Mixia osmundae IAM 14324]